METSTLNILIICGTLISLFIIMIGAGMILKFKSLKSAPKSLMEQILGPLKENTK